MHKFTKATTFAMFALLSLGAVGCAGGNNTNARGIIDLNFWTGFGAAYSNYLSKLIDYQYEHNHINIEHTTQSGYENLQKNINATLNTGDYPNMANGYPDHFAGYAKEDALLDLSAMITKYDEAHASEPGYVKLLDDYYPEYMKENKELKTNCIMGVPFNKSTELMGYNGVFMDYARDQHPEVKVPETWQDWLVYGPTLREVQKSLCGKVLHGKQTAEGTASDFVVNTNASGNDVLIDFSSVKENECRLLSWDSADNMFITIVRDWGSQYTSYTDEDRKSPLQQGYIEFANATNKPKTIEAMKFFDGLYKQMIFGLPADFNASYSSDAFEQNKVMFMVCSTGGLSYNINPGQRFRCAPIPYYKGMEGGAEVIRKYVISQGTNIGIFDQKSPNKDKYNYEQTLDIAFNALVDFSAGERQAQWAIDTGYFPASKSAAETNLYKAFLAEKTYDDPIRVAYREGSQVNQEEYMKLDHADGVKWDKFVDPGFDGSSKIRQRVAYIMGNVFSSTVEGDAKYATVLDAAVNDLKKFVRE